MAQAGAAGAFRGLSAAHALVLRMAFGATFGFAISLALRWEFSFLAPMLAVQMLAALPARPGLGPSLAIPLVILVSTTAALTVSTVFADAPVVLLALVGLVLCWSFYGQRRGAPGAVMLLAQLAFCDVPLLSTISFDLAHSFAGFLLRGSLAAIATVWIAFALFPPPPPPPAGPRPRPVSLPPALAARVAISDTAVLLPLLAAFMVGGDINNLVMLTTTLNLVREVQPGGTGRVALGLLAGNLLGGVLALGAQQFVLAADSLTLFLLTVLLAGLWFASRAARGGPAAHIFVLAFASFLLLMGIAITPLPGGSEQAFLLRFLKIGITSAYAIGALSLVAHLRRERAGDAA